MSPRSCICDVRVQVTNVDLCTIGHGLGALSDVMVTVQVQYHVFGKERFFINCGHPFLFLVFQTSV